MPAIATAFAWDVRQRFLQFNAHPVHAHLANYHVLLTLRFVFLSFHRIFPKLKTCFDFLDQPLALIRT